MVDVEDEVGWGEFFRVRVVLDLSKPTLRRRTIRVRDKPIWIGFKYEKLPKFCFKCGVVRHGSRGYEVSGGRRLDCSGDGSKGDYNPVFQLGALPNRER